jgi:hypothetical protein
LDLVEDLDYNQYFVAEYWEALLRVGKFVDSLLDSVPKTEEINFNSYVILKKKTCSRKKRRLHVNPGV